MTDATLIAETFGCGISLVTDARRTSERVFLATSALLFAAAAAATILRCASMSTMGEVPMPGGWMLSMTWLPVCGRSWQDAAACFLGTWIPMMIAMMLPSLVPMLRRYRHAVGGTSELRLGMLTLLVATGYFLVWTLIGAVIYPLAAALATAAMQSPALARAVPSAVALIVLAAGAFQFTASKAHHLARCRSAAGRDCSSRADAAAALRHGLRLGLHCSYSCAGLTAILLVGGVMDLRTMIVVTAAITAERLTPAGERIAQSIGALVLGAGLLLIAQAVGQ